jgi:uncharacterized membrane protein
LNDAAMLDLIFALKFVHVLAAATMFGVWLCLAIVMLRGHRSGNPSIVAVTTQFVVDVEKMVMAPAIAAQPVSGIPLAWAIGVSPLNEFWIVVSLGLFVVAVACWLAAFRVETRVRRLSRQAALNAVALPGDYRHMFQAWSALAAAGLLATAAIFALMIWQPRLD